MAEPNDQRVQGSNEEEINNESAREQRRTERAEEKRAERHTENESHAKEKKKIRSLAQIVEEKLIADLSSGITSESRRATFACGGSVELWNDSMSHEGISSPAISTKSAESNSMSGFLEPIDIRFGPNGEGVLLTLPHQNDSSAEFQRLVDACQPASFGRGSQEVLDEEYRKAIKLDRTAFATSFCPYEAGIIDVIGQLLLPQTAHDKHSRSIRAELYKLNIYSAPSGRFKAHVDTPRSETQIGSLVVCLPMSHEGGELVIRHAGNEVAFDWSNSADAERSKRVSWAAFYSDCEHEVQEVTAGHRLTLTYNLYATRGLGHLAGESAVLDASNLPLYQPLLQALENPGFLRQGRILGIWLTHSYPHTSTMVDLLPDALKGADMAFYEAFRSLALWCKVVPVMRSQRSDYYENDRKIFLATGRFLRFNRCNNANGNLEEGYGFGSELPLGKITWLNTREDAGAKQVQMAYVTYGNEPGIDIHYTRAAMLVRIPPYLARPETVRPQDFYSGIQDTFGED